MAIITDLANWYPLTADVNDLASGNNGTNYGVSFVADGAITVGDFNGTSDRFTTPHQVNDPFSVEDVTISLWVKSTASGANAVVVGSHYTSGGSTNPLMAMYINTSGLPWLLIRNNSGSLVQATATTAINDGSWHLICFTRTASGVEVFVDGSSEATGNTAGFGTLNNTNSAGVGCWVSVPPATNVATFFSGYISDVATWRRVLSGAEITDIYNAGAGQLAGLIQLQAQALFGSVVHDLPSGPPVYARTLFASVVHEGTAAPAPGGGDSPSWQGQSIQGMDLQGQSLQPSKDLA